MSAKRFVTLLIVAVAVTASVPMLRTADAVEGDYRVAVLPFDTSRVKDAVARERGAQVADLLTGLLSGSKGLEILERAKMNEMLKEHSLNLTGLASAEDQIKIGKLVGAQFLIAGRVFPIDRDICIVAKIISVETSKMKATVVQGPLAGDLAPVIKRLSTNVAKILREQGQALLPKAANSDAIDQVRKAVRAIKGRAKPKFLVSVSESHISRAEQVPDPAAATELLIMLKFCRFTVIDDRSSKEVVSRWAEDFFNDSSAKLPEKGLAGADVLIIGEGISQFGARTGNLITCVARVELQAVDVRTRKVLSVGRATVRKADITEAIAAKSALQAAASKIAVKLIPETLEEWRAAYEKK